MLLKGKSIYIVEDNLRNLIVYQIALVSHGAHLRVDECGQNTIYEMRNIFKCDLIILDLMLSEGKSGFDIIHEIRSISRFEKIPVVAVSATDPSSAIPKAKAMGFSGFIAKPIDKQLFPKQIAEIINGAEIWYNG